MTCYADRGDRRMWIKFKVVNFNRQPQVCDGSTFIFRRSDRQALGSAFKNGDHLIEVPFYIFAIKASAKPDVETSVAPSIWRAKS